MRNGLRWSPDGKFIAYWQFDTTGVREFKLINNTDSLYPQITAFAYPKVGETNSACRVGVVEAGGGMTRWFRPNADPRNHYIPRMEWARDSRQILLQQLNRLQNTNQIIAGDPQTGATRVCFTDRDVVTDGDLKRAEPSMLTDSEEDFNRVMEGTPISRIMIQNPVTTTADTPLVDAGEVLLNTKYGALPVVAGGHLVGIITVGDSLRALVEILREAEGNRGA